MEFGITFRQITEYSWEGEFSELPTEVQDHLKKEGATDNNLYSFLSDHSYVLEDMIPMADLSYDSMEIEEAWLEEAEDDS